MGNSATYLGPQTDLMVNTFPTLSTISSARSLESNALAIQSTFTNYAAVPTSLIPVAGPLLTYLLVFLGSTDFRDVSGGYVKAQIDESLLENDIIHYNSEITGIRNSLLRLNRSDLTSVQLQPEITYALRRSEYLFNIFKQPNHVLHKYPVVSMPHFIKITNIFWSVLQISSKLDPSLKSTNDVLRHDMSPVIRTFVDKFLETRLKDISSKSCGHNIFQNQCLIYDRPWIKTPGHDINYFFVIYPSSAPLIQTQWRDGIVLRTPNPCYTEERDYPNLSSYKDTADYKDKLKRGYAKYFKNSFPVVY